MFCVAGEPVHLWGRVVGIPLSEDLQEGECDGQLCCSLTTFSAVGCGCPSNLVQMRNFTAVGRL